MAIFDNKSRNDAAAPRPTETVYSYLNRCPEPWVAEIRRFLEELESGFPESRKKDKLIDLIKSKDDREHYSALFELLVYSLLKKVGLEVEIEPKVGGAVPDFLVIDSDGRKCLIEASTITGLSDEEWIQMKTYDRVHECIDKIIHPDFVFAVFFEKWPTRTPKLSRLSKFIKISLQSIDYDVVTKEILKGNKNSPNRSFYLPEQFGMKLRLKVIPKSTGKRAKPESRSIAFTSHPAQFLNYAKHIEKKLKEKSSKYGKLDFPYILALNCMSLHPGRTTPWREEIIDALIGCPTAAVIEPQNTDSIGIENVWIHRSNALLNSGKNTRISGVLFFRNLKARTIWYADGGIIGNPHAINSLPPWVEFFDVFDPMQEEDYSRRKSQPFAKAFNLSDGWPGDSRKK